MDSLDREACCCVCCAAGLVDCGDLWAVGGQLPLATGNPHHAHGHLRRRPGGAGGIPDQNLRHGGGGYGPGPGPPPCGGGGGPADGGDPGHAAFFSLLSNLKQVFDIHRYLGVTNDLSVVCGVK